MELKLRLVHVKVINYFIRVIVSYNILLDINLFQNQFAQWLSSNA